MDILRRISAVLGGIILTPVSDVWRKLFAKGAGLVEPWWVRNPSKNAKFLEGYLQEQHERVRLVEEREKRLEETERKADAIREEKLLKTLQKFEDLKKTKVYEDENVLVLRSSPTTYPQLWTRRGALPAGMTTTNACSTGTYSVCVKRATKRKQKPKPGSGRKSGEKRKNRG
jgi:hypothetical protein